MNVMQLATPWHRASFERLMLEQLPALIAERMPLAGYSAEVADDHSWRVSVALGAGGEQVSLTFDALPGPDEDGIVQLERGAVVALPMATSHDLSQGVRCVGDQLLERIASQLGDAPADIAWDEASARSWLPLDRWWDGFFTPSLFAFTPVQMVQHTNALARATQLRRVILPGPGGESHAVWRTEWRGLLCPFETPEGTNIGRVRTLAVGAVIRDGRIERVDDAPAAGLGLSASMVPLIEFDDSNRVLMAVNMMRQALVPPAPEPALVQTGAEGDDNGVWTGRNLLTAFVSLGCDTYEDGIVVSTSAAAKLDWPDALEPGDKLSNRHGAKGVIARIVPDSEMPQLPDGTPVELVVSFIGAHTRMNQGQVREALLGRVAQASGKPFVAPPFDGPDDNALRTALRDAGLSETGMETLTDGATGKAMQRPSTVGYVYWCKLHHLAARKLRVGARPDDGVAQFYGPPEYADLKQAGATAVARDLFHTSRVDRHDAATLVDRMAAGDITPPSNDSPVFARIAKALRACGISADFDGHAVTFAACEPSDGVELAEPIPHPWDPQRVLTRVGDLSDRTGWPGLVAANERIARLSTHGGPASLRAGAFAELERSVAEVFDHAFDGDEHAAPSVLYPSARVLMAGRSEMVPASDVASDQLGVPDAMAWALFGLLAARDVGTEAVAGRTDEAADALDRRMADTWIVLNRRGSVSPISTLAFHARRVSGRAIELPPTVCQLLGSDFDGDQAALFLPPTDAARCEAGERLSLVARLTHDRSLLDLLVPVHEAMWGLAERARSQAGREEIAAIVGGMAIDADTLLSRNVVTQAVRAIADAAGIGEAVRVCEALTALGMAAARRSGASICAFAADGVDRAGEPKPADDSDGDAERWLAHRDRLVERLGASCDFDDPSLGPQLIAVKSDARGTVEHLATFAGSCGAVAIDGEGSLVAAPHGLAQGLSPDEAFTRPGTTQARLIEIGAATASAIRRAASPTHGGPGDGWGVFARAMRSHRPGVTFAHAAARGEVDRLTEIDVQLLLGLGSG